MSKRQSSEIQHSASASNGEAVIYLRISTSESQKGILSLPAQSELLRKYGHSSALRIVAEFVDIENAKTRGRSSFTQMVTFLQKNPSVKHILVEKTDRLNRNFKDYVLISDLGCALHIVKDGKVTYVDSNSPETLQHRIKIVLAKIFIDDLGKAVRKGMTEKPNMAIGPPTRHLATLMLSFLPVRISSCRTKTEPSLYTGFLRSMQLAITRSNNWPSGLHRQG
jgi:hypothetical protein